MQPMIINFKNNPKKTLFSPQFSYYMFHTNILDKIDVELMKTTILSKEKEVIENNKYVNDWGTGLGPESMTSRSDSINILKWNEFLSLKDIIREQHDVFLQGLGFSIEKKLYSQCWANVLRENQCMKKHAHWSSAYSYLSGHLCLQVGDTNTCYVNPIDNDVYKSKNEIGKLTLFESWLPHYTENHRSENNSERITIAFDIIPEITYVEDIIDPKKDHWVKI